MKAFRFRLERVLDWRRTELGLEESRLKQIHAAITALDRERAELESAATAARSQIARRESLDALDLHALSAFRESVDTQRQRLAGKRRQREAEIVTQQQKLMEARRRCRLLDNLRERRMAEWKYQTRRQEEAETPPRPAAM